MSTTLSLAETAQDICAGRDTAARLYLALQIVKNCDDPEDFAALDMFLGMVSEHCAEVKLGAAIKADLDAHEEQGCDLAPKGSPLWIGWDMAGPEGGIPADKCNSAGPNQSGGDAETQATTTHEQSMPVPESGPRSMRAALASVRDAVARSDDSWFFQALGAVSLFALMLIGLFAGEIFK